MLNDSTRNCSRKRSPKCIVRAPGFTDVDLGIIRDFHHFQGARRRFTQDLSHPKVIYEPGKCISCEACVRIAAAAGEEVGLALIGRGFEVAVAPPFGKPLSETLRTTARRCAEACPTGALALRTARSCDFCR